MSKILKIIIAMSFALCFSVSANAANNDIDVEINDYSAKISGKADCKEGTEVVISVIRPQKDVAQIKEDSKSDSATQIFANVMSIAQTTVNSKNEFSNVVKFEKTEKSGTYLVRCKIYTEDSVREKEIKFVNNELKTASEEALKNQTDTVENILNEHATDLDIDAGELYNTFTKAQKQYVIDEVSKATGSKKDAFINSVSMIEDVEKIKSADKGELKQIADKGEVVGVDAALYQKYKALSSFKKDLFISAIYDKLRNVQVPNDVNNAFEKGFDAVSDSNTSPSGSGGGGGGGSSSGSKSPFGGVAPTQSNNEIIETVDIIDEFDDLESVPWAENAIKILFEKKIINGKGNNKFCPQDEITREEFLKLVVASLNIIGVSDKENIFSDVVSGAWYEDVINTAVALEIVNGIDENTFGIGRSIKRQEMAAMLYRAVKCCDVNLYDVADTKFLDEEDFSEYAVEAIDALSKAKVINGMENGCFMPHKTATRAEAAVMIYNLLYR